MQSKTAKLVNQERVIELLECYGADAEYWPQEERAAAGALINSSADLQQRQREARQLDEAMGVRQTRESLQARPQASIVANIMDALPEQPGGNTVNFHQHAAARGVKKSVKRRGSWWLYGAFAAAAAVVLAVGVVIQQPLQSLPSSHTPPLRTAAVADAVSQDEMDRWLWQDVTGLGEGGAADLAQEDADLPATFLAMVELDLMPNNDDE